MALPADPVIVLGLGLVLMVKFSDITVGNIIKFSKITGISTMVMGFILLALGTSLPEMAVTIISSLRGDGIVGVSTLFGSNIADLAILGMASLFISFRIPRDDQKSMTQVILVTSAISVLALVLGSVNFVFGIFSIIVFYLITKPIVHEGTENTNGMIKSFETFKSLLIIFLSLAVVLLSAWAVSEATIGISRNLGIYESFIGATIIAFSTSMPELMVSISAIRKGNVSLLVGNILGSLMINLTLLLGLAAMISSVILDIPTTTSIIMLLVFNAVFFPMIKSEFNKIHGIGLLSLYFVFVFLLYGVSS
jgi:cation:H+ antiporter